MPAELWLPEAARVDAARAFAIADPIARYQAVSEPHWKRAAQGAPLPPALAATVARGGSVGVLDLHFQSTKTAAVVLDAVLWAALERHAEVWVVTGTGHHTDRASHQRSAPGGVLWSVVHEYLEAELDEHRPPGPATRAPPPPPLTGATAAAANPQCRQLGLRSRAEAAAFVDTADLVVVADRMEESLVVLRRLLSRAGWEWGLFDLLWLPPNRAVARHHPRKSSRLATSSSPAGYLPSPERRTPRDTPPPPPLALPPPIASFGYSGRRRRGA